jgi:beta-glucanase (GH16 family)
MRRTGGVATVALLALGLAACASQTSTDSALGDPTAGPTSASPSPSASATAATPGPARLELRPPIGQNTDGQPQVPGLATFTPAHPGAPVTIEKRQGPDGWTRVASGTQDEHGQFSFLTSTASGTEPSARYRASTTLNGSPVYSPEASNADWHLVWHDEFDGTTFGPEWTLRGTGPASKRSCASTTADMGSVSGGYATFRVAKDPSNTPPVDPKLCPVGRLFNAQWDTHTSELFRYGVFAARMKMERPEGMHGAFWMLPGREGPTNPAPDDPGQTGVEIDINEYFGDNFGPGEGNGDYYAYVYWPQRQADGTIKSIKTGDAQHFARLGDGQPSDGYHVYSVEWTPNNYIFRVDGVETSRLTVGISHRKQFLLFSLLTSDWEVPRLTDDALPASMSVDWVRVWQQ